MKYKVGDKVRVKEALVEEAKYGGLLFIHEMSKYCGMVATILSRTDWEPCPYYDLDIDIYHRFAWSDEMLEPVYKGRKEPEHSFEAPKLDLSLFEKYIAPKEDTHMKNVFATIDDTRIDKTCNKKVDTVTTYAWGVKGGSWTTCDKTEYDPYVGALVAAAKITATQFEEAHLLYDLAMNMWGTDTSKAILKTLANRAFGGMFENAYAKWQRQIAQTEKWTKEQSLKCKVCGKTFDTEDEARAHEQWHIDNKKTRRQRYLDRKEAKKRMAEAEREKRIKAYVDAFTALGDEKKRRGI